MRQYSIMQHGSNEFFLAEGTAESGCVYEPSKRESFADMNGLMDYIERKISPKKKIQFNIGPELPDDLEGRIEKLRPKALFKRVEFRRKSPPAVDYNAD